MPHNTTPKQTLLSAQRLLSLITSFTFVILITAMPITANAIDEPTYTVVQTTDAFEVRQYAPYLVAEVLVLGPVSDAGNQGFSLLGGYIFGKTRASGNLK